MRLTLLALAAVPITLFLQACPPTDDDDSVADDGPPVIEQYLAGEQAMTLSDGTTLAPQRTLIWRRLFPTEDRITERIEQEDGEGGVDSFDVSIVVDPDDFTFTLSFTDAFGTLEGTGQFGGEPWVPGPWTSRTEYVDGDLDGTWIQSTDVLDDDGLRATKEVHRSDDSLIGTVNETLLWVDAADWHEEAEAFGEGP